MRHLFILLSLILFILSSSISAYADSDNIIKFKLEIKPNQQKVEAKIDSDEHKQIQIRAEYIKLNTITNNYHIKVTITNNSGIPLLHQLALIDKVEHAEIKYPDSTTEYIKYDDGKQMIKTLPYYNYGNIKPMQATPREWYLLNTGKDEIEVEGYIISKEIPVVLDPKIAQTNQDVALVFSRYLQALQDNDMDALLKLLARADKYSDKDLAAEFEKIYSYDKTLLLRLSPVYKNIKNIVIYGNICEIKYEWLNEDDNKNYTTTFVLQNGGSTIGWIVTKN